MDYKSVNASTAVSCTVFQYIANRTCDAMGEEDGKWRGRTDCVWDDCPNMRQLYRTFSLLSHRDVSIYPGMYSPSAL